MDREEYKAALRSWVDERAERIREGRLSIEYVYQGAPPRRVGVIVSLRDHGGAWRVGWSYCSERDQFDRKKGLMIATSRAIAGRTAFVDDVLYCDGRDDERITYQMLREAAVRANVRFLGVH